MDIGSYVTLGSGSFVVALVALGFSGGAWRASHRAANAAEAAVAEAKRSADASERSARAAERQAAAAADSLALQQEAAKPRVDLRIRQVGQGSFRLINLGQADAVGLEVFPEDAHLLEAHDPWGERLAARESRELSFWGADRPVHVRFVWGGQADPVYVEVEG
ncbi:hypothetical protein OG592_26920 [Streptomyces avidinii]|uniref:hypothetical protein n=1 Tax=Streptomyces avidinii TaxID=1895 RepID=UPI00386FFB8B|nr:hypothetical protein OG592_26920 [Streptomyces avidinii]